MQKLKSDVVGFLGAVTLGVVMLSPAMTIYGNFGPTFLGAGKAAPLVFFLALLATIPTALSCALLSRSYPSSGSASTWIAQTGFPRAARWAGWMVFLYYLTNFTIQPITMGVFLNDFLRSMGLLPNIVTFILGAVSCCACAAWLAYRGISVSVKGAFTFLLIETVIVTALCLTVTQAPTSPFSLEGFHVSASPDGATGIFRALIFGMLSFCGFDVISTLGDEAKMSKRLIPQATFVALAVFGALMIGGIWLLTYATSIEQLKAIADAGGMPVSEIARIFWGKWSVLVPITAISAALGIAIATSVGASRILHSMAERKDAPGVFATLNTKYASPWNAMHVIFACGFCAAIGTVLFLGPYQTYVWWGTTSTFFAMLTYLVVNFANLMIFRKEITKGIAPFFLHGVVPVLGIAIDVYILVKAFFIELWNQGWANGQSVIAFDLTCATVAAIVACRRRLR